MIRRKINIDYNFLFKTCLDFVKSQEDYINISHDHSKGVILFETTSSFLSWGEVITINIYKKNNASEIIVSSKSKAQLISWGVNSKNEEFLIKSIMNLIK